ncbi:MAG: hypothetical protein H0X03_03705 [Nitrosopumilus sp.]|nr:hypothetical protein [Nitrosopumilus sp.]
MNNDNVKKGADYLLKGGTLLSEPCQVCNGLLVKFKGDIMCLTCQKDDVNERELRETPEGKNMESTNEKHFDKDNINRANELKESENGNKELLLTIKKTIAKKIFEINKSVYNESDSNKQKNNLEILFLYLKILGKIKKIE